MAFINEAFIKKYYDYSNCATQIEGQNLSTPQQI
jgi:hypothetical protein